MSKVQEQPTIEELLEANRFLRDQLERVERQRDKAWGLLAHFRERMFTEVSHVQSEINSELRAWRLPILPASRWSAE